MKIKKAVIPAAGLGTRMLPASKANPKEMLTIVDKPAIQYIVEEAVASGIEDILIIISRGKTAVEDHFDRNPELEQRLASSGRDKELAEMLKISDMANIHFLRQHEMNGLGHAVYQAKAFIGNDDFAVLYGDDVIIGETPACLELCQAHEKYGLGVVGIKPVSMEQIRRYSSMKLSPIEGDSAFKITDMIEKPPAGKEFSNYSILGRCVLPPKIFGILENTPRGAGGEIQLTDAMRTLSVQDSVIGVDFSGKRYDMGNKLGYMQANVEVALTHPDIGADFREYLMDLAKSL